LQSRCDAIAAVENNQQTQKQKQDQDLNSMTSHNQFFRFFVTLAVSTIVSQVFAQQPDSVGTPDSVRTPGQRQIQKLSSMVGEWEVTEKNGDASTMTISWINNKSFIELVHGEYREITRWDLVEKRFVTQAFGEVGGHAKYVWTAKEKGIWKLVAEPAYYVASGKAVPWSATIEQVDGDTMKFQGTFGDHKMENTARRKQPHDRSMTVPEQ